MREWVVTLGRCLEEVPETFSLSAFEDIAC